MEIEALEPEPHDYLSQQKPLDIFDPTNYEVPGQDVHKKPAKDDEADVHSSDVGLAKFQTYDPEGNPLAIDLDQGRTPIKATPFLTRHKRNRVRRVGAGKGRENSVMPDLAAMLSPKNKYTKDIYGRKTEAVEHRLKNEGEESPSSLGDYTIKIDPQFGRAIKSVFAKLESNLNVVREKQKLLTEENDIDIDIDLESVFVADDDEAIFLELTDKSGTTLNEEQHQQEQDHDDIVENLDIETVDETSLSEVFNGDS